MQKKESKTQKTKKRGKPQSIAVFFMKLMLRDNLNYDKIYATCSHIFSLTYDRGNEDQLSDRVGPAVEMFKKEFIKEHPPEVVERGTINIDIFNRLN